MGYDGQWVQIFSPRWCEGMRCAGLSVHLVLPNGTTVYERLFDYDGLEDVLHNRQLWEFYSDDIRHQLLTKYLENKNGQWRTE